jgi:hypothetical protein
LKTFPLHWDGNNIFFCCSATYCFTKLVGVLLSSCRGMILDHYSRESSSNTMNAAALVRSVSLSEKMNSPLYVISTSEFLSLLCYARITNLANIFLSTYLLNSLFFFKKHLFRSFKASSFYKLVWDFDLMVCLTTLTIGY